MAQMLLGLLLVPFLGTTIATSNYEQDASERWVWKTEFKKPQTLNPIQRPGTNKVDIPNLDLFSSSEFSSLKLENKESIHIPRLVFMKRGAEDRGENIHEAIFNQAKRGITSSANQKLPTTLKTFVPKRPLSQNLGTQHKGVIHVDQLLSEARTTTRITTPNDAEADLKVIPASSKNSKKHLDFPKGVEIVPLSDVLSGTVQLDSIKKHISSYLAKRKNSALKGKDVRDAVNLDAYKSTLASIQELPVHEPDFSSSSSSKTQGPSYIPRRKLKQRNSLEHSVLEALPKGSVIDLSAQEKAAPRNSFKRTALNITPRNINQLLNEGRFKLIKINLGQESGNVLPINTDNSNRNLIDIDIANDDALERYPSRDIDKTPNPGFQDVYGISQTPVNLLQENVLQNKQPIKQENIIKAELLSPNPHEQQWRGVYHPTLKNVQTKNIQRGILSKADSTFSVIPSVPLNNDFSPDLPSSSSPYSPKKPLKVFDAELTDAFSIPESSNKQTYVSGTAYSLGASENLERGSQPNELADAFARLQIQDQNRILEILAKGRSKYLNRRSN